MVWMPTAARCFASSLSGEAPTGVGAIPSFLSLALVRCSSAFFSDCSERK